jgi:hypothetical protein
MWPQGARAFATAFGVGQKPVDADAIEDTLALDLDGMEARFTRNGYNVKVVTGILTAKPKEIRSFLNGQASESRNYTGWWHILAKSDANPTPMKVCSVHKIQRRASAVRQGVENYPCLECHCMRLGPYPQRRLARPERVELPTSWFKAISK